MSAVAGYEGLVDVGGHCLVARCVGKGSPTIVIDAGLGEGRSAWTNIQNRVATFSRVCAYDRAGVGDSDRGPTPRTSRQMVRELRALLGELNIEPPYVLVGHSLGGLNAQLFATQYPDEVAGLVLVDPSFPDMLERFAAVLSDVWLPLWNSQFQSDAEGMTAEDFTTSCAQVAAAGPLPHVPLIVLSAGQPVQLPPDYSSFPSADVLRVMQEGHAAIANASTQGRHVIVENSSHANILLQEERTVDAIRQVVEAVR